ncbi:hypothetical protein [Microbacterium aerolatum]|uniref:hypothetical protein n=1 Tax=Microbacterium aerolatum TaxID=153731 RepID=UPI0011BF84DF|nr:hypothetical protein [Microbacterium aerolatum]
MSEIVIHPVSDSTELDALLRRAHAGDEFTFAARAGAAGFSGRRLCLVSLPAGRAWMSDYLGDTYDWPSSIVAIAVATTGRRITTVDTQIRLGPILALAEPIDEDGLVANLPLSRSQLDTVAEAIDRGRRLPPVTSRRIVDALEGLAGTDGPAVRAMLSQLTGTVIERGRRGSVLQQERDAVMLAGEIFGAREAFRPALRSMEAGQGGRAPFLARVTTAHQLEDHVINSDARNFLDWTREEEIAAAALTFRQGDRALTIINANKAPLERLTGADLIYFNHPTGSFVLVQYKMMEAGSDGWTYRPDRQFDAERQRLGSVQAAHDRARTSSIDVTNYRFSESVAYFKFCKRNGAFSSDETRLMPGYYVTDEFLGLYLDEFRTPRGARLVTEAHLADRALYGAGFARMVAAGLVGTRASTSEEINRVVAESLSGNRAVVFAFEGPSRERSRGTDDEETEAELIDPDPEVLRGTLGL